MKTGIFVGSFNPITKAHLEIKDYLINNHIVDNIVYLPINNQRKKRIALDTRINMLKLILDNNTSINDIMKKYDKFNYLVVNELDNYYENMYFILGSDVFKYFNTFDNYESLLKKYHFIVINRGDSKDIINSYHTPNIIFLDYHNPISSTMVRDLIKNNQDCSSYVDERIISFIKEKSLFK